MDFEFTAEERDFIRQVKEFLRENHDPLVMDVTRENMAQVCDTPGAARIHEEGRRARLARDHVAEGVRRPGR
jgi:DNA replication initiation complex subunit (GINS family)